MGEQPCLWSSLKLKLKVAGTARSMQVLQGVLNMRRLQTLKQLTLDFISAEQTNISWQDFIHLLLLLPPSVQKLSLERLAHVHPLPPSHVLAEELVAQPYRFPRVFGDEFGDEFGDSLNFVSKLVTHLVIISVNRRIW